MEPPAVPPSAAMGFRVRLRTRWSDEDNQGVLNNAVYLTLFEEARHAYFGSLELLAQNRFPFLLAQTNVLFLRPGRGGAEVELEVATTHLGQSSIAQAYRVRELPAGQVLCEAQARLVCYDPATGASTAMDATLRARVGEREGFTT